MRVSNVSALSRGVMALILRRSMLGGRICANNWRTKDRHLRRQNRSPRRLSPQWSSWARNRIQHLRGEPGAGGVRQLPLWNWRSTA
jgi:hypothetical protein